MTPLEIKKERSSITNEYKELLKSSYRKLTVDDKKLIRKAFDVALEGHKNQRAQPTLEVLE